MSGKFNISSLFDQSGNLTLNAMERYLRDELSSEELSLVEDHLAKSEFDHEALEGMKNSGSAVISEDVKNLNSDILFAARKKAEKSVFVISRKTYLYAAAGLAGLIGLSVLMFFMFRSTDDKPQLAVAQPDTIINSPASSAGISENSRIVEKEKPPVTEQKRDIDQEVNPSAEKPSRVDEVATERIQPIAHQEIIEYDQPDLVAEEIINIVNDNEIIEEQVVGGIAITDATKAKEENLDRKGERVTTNYQVQAQNAVSASEYQAPEEASESQIFMVVESMPEFPGGEKALYKFLEENINYPASARQASIQGKVYVTFVVNKDGSISEARVLRGIGGGCDEEALRVVKSMPDWIPGTQRGVPVRVQYNLPIKFSLE